MLEYGHIVLSSGQAHREFDAYVFDKLDGNHCRAEWTRKRGWDKFGNKEHRFDETDPMYRDVRPIFMAALAEPLEKAARGERWQKMTAFFEFWGEASLGGVHVPGAPMTVSLFDVASDRDEILGPREYLKLCEDMSFVAPFLGRFRWTRGFMERVYNGDVPGVTREGVVGKARVRDETLRAKCKTKAWLDLIHERFPREAADRIVNS